MLSVKVLLILSATTLLPQSRRMLTISLSSFKRHPATPPTISNVQHCKIPCEGTKAVVNTTHNSKGTTACHLNNECHPISPMNPSIGKIGNPYHAMHLQHLILQLYTTTSNHRPSNLPNRKNSVAKLVLSSQSPSGHTVASHPHMQSKPA